MFLANATGRSRCQRLLGSQYLFARHIKQMVYNENHELVFDKPFADKSLLKIHGAVEMIRCQLFRQQWVKMAGFRLPAVIPCIHDMAGLMVF